MWEWAQRLINQFRRTDSDISPPPVIAAVPDRETRNRSPAASTGQGSPAPSTGEAGGADRRAGQGALPPNGPTASKRAKAAEAYSLAMGTDSPRKGPTFSKSEAAEAYRRAMGAASRPIEKPDTYRDARDGIFDAI